MASKRSIFLIILSIFSVSSHQYRHSGTKLPEIGYQRNSKVTSTCSLVTPKRRERCEINGYEVAIRIKVIINGLAIKRDPQSWTNADCFEPERFYGTSIDFKGRNFGYITFGAARRICPSISFGTANIELPLAQLLYHFDWKLQHGIKPEELDMTKTFGATARRRSDLHLIGIPYAP